MISQTRSWPTIGSRGLGTGEAIMRSADWPSGSGTEESPDWPLLLPGPKGLCVARGRPPDGQALAWVRVVASELHVTRADQHSDE